ncbi:hypothetical protein AERO8C_30152 [Aeromonas veronii]|uniref:Uncharacterized protein n=1 Tax=Aeromonas veronii TaxID=654 RepID=A0A653L4I4_AERVE|nr:hypothetical protein AERO8C_30152 [Aeromonas veronii]
MNHEQTRSYGAGRQAARWRQDGPDPGEIHAGSQRRTPSQAGLDADQAAPLQPEDRTHQEHLAQEQAALGV